MMSRWLLLLVLAGLFAAGNAHASALGSAGPSGRVMVLTGGAAAVVSNSAENMFPVQGNFTAAAAAAEGNVMQNLSLGGTVSQLNCYLTVAGGTKTVAGGTSYVMALRDNTTDTALTCTIATAASACTDATHNVTVSPSDQLDFSATPSGTPTALIPHCAAVFAY